MRAPAPPCIEYVRAGTLQPIGDEPVIALDEAE